MLSQPGFSEMDQWGVQVQAQIQSKADVYVYSACLSEEEIRKALLIPCHDLNEALLSLPARYGRRVCVLPEGPQVIAYL